LRRAAWDERGERALRRQSGQERRLQSGAPGGFDMTIIAKISAMAVPVALFCAACGGSDTYVQPADPSTPVTVVQPAPAAPAAPAAAPTTNVEVNTPPPQR
jgi:hypothetical protein